MIAQTLLRNPILLDTDVPNALFSGGKYRRFCYAEFSAYYTLTAYK